MCGIFGSINLSSVKENILYESLLHRGPDASGSYVFNNVFLYHSRLSIQDIEQGQQPMHYKHLTIIFNGEIYNHLDLRKKFNLNCRTYSDTETILKLYELIGQKMLDEFDGMFALAILDKRENKIFIARDRAGKKPLYIYKNNNQIAFASELNVFAKLFYLDINEQNIYQYLRLGSCYRKNTPYKNIKEVENGTYVKINTSDFSISKHKWWSINDFYLKENKITFDAARESIDNLLHQSIKYRLESSDLEVGSFLSGGIDSGLVTAIGSNYTSKLKTFTVSFDGAYDEAPLAKLVAQKYGTVHEEIKISFDNLKNDIKKILVNYGEPFSDSSAIPSYYVSKAAKEHLTVILNGDGADELFGGYRRYVPFKQFDFFNSSNFLRTFSIMLKRVVPPSNNKKSMLNYLYRLIELSSKNGLHCYLSATTDIFEGFENAFSNSGYNYLSDFQNDFNDINSKEITGLSKIMNMDFNTILFSDLLVKMDIATMANSLEGRSPFLSKELLEFVPRLPGKYKISGTNTKHILRDLAKDYLPQELINQPKRGFEIPLKNWVENDLKDIIYSHLTPSSYSVNFVKKTFLNDLLDKRIKVSDEKRAKMIWILFTLEVWYKNFAE